MSDPLPSAVVPQPAVASRRDLISRALFTGAAAIPVMGYFSSTAKAANQTLTDGDREAFRDIRSHENDHVQKIKAILGKLARPKPTFKGLATTSFDQFVTLSRTFENVGVGAYLGALPAITNKDYIAFAGSVALIEARHAGFLNVFSNKDVSLQAKNGIASAVDRPLTVSEVVTAVSPFLVSLNGGPAASFTAGDDVSIVNFALLLEYLEAEFYNINVPKYF